MKKALAIVGWLMLTPLAAGAQDSAPEDAAADAPPETTAAQARFEEGVEHLRNEQYEEAAAAFRESYRLDPSITTMCNLALTFDRWGGAHRAQAVRAYRTCARDDESAQYRAYAEQRVGELERELALEEDSAEAAEEEAALSQPPPAEEHEPLETDVVTPPSEADPTVLITGIAVTVAALGPLIAAIVLATDADATVERLREETGGRIVGGSVEHQQLLTARDQSNAAIGLYVATGVVAATGLALLIADLVLRTNPPVSVGASRDGAWLAARGRF